MEQSTSQVINPIARIKSRRIQLPVIPEHKTATSLSLRLVYGFLGLIAIGGGLLVLPISSAAGQLTPPIDAFFTATSAVCVTGLAVVDTGTYWSTFGQGVIMALIQIGGFGFMTSATLLVLAFGRRIGLMERLMVGESIGLMRLGGIVKILKRMALFTLACEGIGVGVFFYRFSREAPIGEALWTAAFHSISAFNNAGFDIFGNYRSLIGYQADHTLVLATAALIFLGGISFIVVADLMRSRNLARLSLDSKLVLTTTLILLAAGSAVMMYAIYSGDGLGQGALNAFFTSVTARTAGFTVVNIAGLTQYALFFMMALMFIGGASGSTAGGIKVNTFSMLIATIWSTIRGREHPSAFNRELAMPQIQRAVVVTMLSLGIVSLSTFLLAVHEDFALTRLMFESISAFGTVGLTTGITPHLSMAGRIIIAVTIFVGRLGPLTLSLVFLQRQRPSTYRYPRETVRIG